MNYIQYAQQAIPGGILYITIPSDNTRVNVKEPIEPIIYLDEEVLAAAQRLGVSVEEYLKMLKKQLQTGVVYEDAGSPARNYYRSRTAAKPYDEKARDAAAVEQQRQDEAEAKAKAESLHALEVSLTPITPSAIIGLGTGAMDIKTGEAKDTPEGLLWDETRVAQDLLLPVAAAGAYRGIRSGIRLADGLARKAYAPYDLYRTIGETKLPLGLPLNVGWAPRLSFDVVHASNSEKPLQVFYPQRWDVVNEGANPFGIWYLGKLGTPRTVAANGVIKSAKAEKARKLFASRPYQLDGTLTLEKPLQTIGDVPDRAALSYQAERLGADGIIYNGVYDNGYNNNLVILSLRVAGPRLTQPVTSSTPSKTISFGEVPQGGLLKISFGNRFGESSDFLTNEALDPYSVYILRAKAKGVTDEQLKAIKQFNLHTEEGRKQAAKHIVDKFGLDEGETLENALKNYELLFYEMSIEDGGFGAGMGWNDLEMVHIDPNLRPHKDIPWIIAHETEHALHVPEAPLEQGILDESRLTGELKEYMTGNNNTEVGARISQVLNNAGVTDASTFSGKQLKLLFEQYLASNNMNNEMWSLYKAVKDWDGLAKWANNPKNVYRLAFPLTLGTTYGLTLKKHGGTLNYLNYIK